MHFTISLALLKIAVCSISKKIGVSVNIQNLKNIMYKALLVEPRG